MEARRARGSERAKQMAKSIKVKNVTVTICLAVEEGLDAVDGGKWLLMCEDHGSILQDTNKSRLWSNAREVETWCGRCRNEMAVA